MKRILIPVLAFVAFISVSPRSYATTLLGDAVDYNVFVFSDMSGRLSGGSDVQGRVAAGGNFTAKAYSVGLNSPDAPYSLVTGGNVIWGDAVQGGTINNGGIYSGGNVTLYHYGVNGDVVAKGTVTRTGGTITGGTVYDINSNPSSAGFSSPVDFTAAEIYLKGVSQDLSHGTINGTTTYSYSNISLSGNNPVNMFYVDGGKLNDATSLTFNFASDEIGIVNISGASIDLGSGSMIGGIAGNILFNFYEATNLNIHNVGVTGSILAPYANITFPCGTVLGTVIAESTTGGGQYNLALFDHEIPGGSQPVPEPATMLLLGSGLAGLAATRFKRKPGN